jgi:hypothetical protein
MRKWHLDDAEYFGFLYDQNDVVELKLNFFFGHLKAHAVLRAQFSYPYWVASRISRSRVLISWIALLKASMLVPA